VSEPQRSLYVTADDRPWQERRPGVHWKVLWEEGDRKAVLMRYAPGATIPRHRHSGDEQIFVLEGAVSDDTGTHPGELRAAPAGLRPPCVEPRGRPGPGDHDGRDRICLRDFPKRSHQGCAAPPK